MIHHSDSHVRSYEHYKHGVICKGQDTKSEQAAIPQLFKSPVTNTKHRNGDSFEISLLALRVARNEENFEVLGNKTRPLPSRGCSVEAFTHHHQPKPSGREGEGGEWKKEIKRGRRLIGGRMNDEYLDAILDGDAGERVHPSNLVLQEVAVGERRRGRRRLRREDGAAEGVVLVGERVRDPHGDWRAKSGRGGAGWWADLGAQSRARFWDGKSTRVEEEENEEGWVQVRRRRRWKEERRKGAPFLVLEGSLPAEGQNEMEFFGRKSKARKQATKQSLHSLPLSLSLFIFLHYFYLFIFFYAVPELII